MIQHTSSSYFIYYSVLLFTYFYDNLYLISRCFAIRKGKNHRMVSILSTNRFLEDKIFIHYSLINHDLILNEIEHLISYNNKINRIVAGCFSSMPNIRKLDLRSCKIESIDDNVFSSLLNLNELDLSSNNIEQLNSSMFNGLVNLRKLRLNRLKIKRFDPNCFQHFNNLRELELEQTSFDIFPTNLLTNNLRKLNIFNFTPRPNTSFNPFNNLQQLECFTGNYFYFNLLKQIRKDNLKQVILFKSDWDMFTPRISNGFFNGFPNLRVLNIYRSGIDQFEDNVFDRLTKLEKLSIIDNRINGSNFNELFSKLTNLKVLCLKQNPINNIKNGYFENLRNLCILDLQSCQLSSIDLSAFQVLSNLEKLDLSNNRAIETVFRVHQFNFLAELKYFNKERVNQNQIV